MTSLRRLLVSVGALSIVVMGGLSVARTAGLTVPPSNVGQTTIAVSKAALVPADSPGAAVATDLVVSGPDSTDGRRCSEPL